MKFKTFANYGLSSAHDCRMEIINAEVILRFNTMKTSYVLLGPG